MPKNYMRQITKEQRVKKRRTVTVKLAWVKKPATSDHGQLAAKLVRCTGGTFTLTARHRRTGKESCITLKHDASPEQVTRAITKLSLMQRAPRTDKPFAFGRGKR